MIILEKARLHLKQNLSFVVFKKPNENLVKGYFQFDHQTHFFDGQNGFVFKAFDNKLTFCIPNDKSLFSEEIFFKNENTSQNFTLKSNPSEANYFKSMVDLAKSEISKQTFEKVVLSRQIEIETNENYDAFQSFLNAVQTYESAFVYLLFHQEVGFWLGATPELLLKINDFKLETVSLAGTKQNHDTQWQPKEFHEQKLVTDYIIQVLSDFVSNTKVSETQTIRAGQLDHLMAKISGTLSNDYRLFDLLNVLHPTPAVCGLPRENALTFILTNENHNRGFYTGFLGEHQSNQSEIYVNLRCMQILNEMILVYVGCGITADSDPEKEFMETENKSKTMLSIL